ncbi:hydantoinase B/oxoprolinase family protein [Rhodococcus artemisiae]|uniref:Hydantoinase B/oxoprolinase family protein n=1 Tax=Rhodococcus artemisiae TaxID=714159 RepID=A0ABU7LL96_9NOCA|nr:hydantoinase B/oxoprolinase family protein [Rhodococcus artemisiae]MEE2062290.1 hydantoinase B/oxoprolinase family protein [Rhodococcus artemisiae]
MTHNSAITIKELSDAEFEARYDCDRYTATVLSNRMRYIVEHMCTNLLHHAFSLILRDWYDFAATISGPPSMNYPMSTVSNSLVIFAGSMSYAVRNAVEEYGPNDLQPGDVLMVNDPYRAGTHVNDVCFIRPVFHDGEIVTFVALRAHQLDMGGPIPAGFSATKKDVYETGLVIPPTLMYRNDKPVKSAFNMIFDNARYCTLLLPDLNTIHENLLLGERLMHESIERYGVEAWLGAIQYSCDVAAESMSTAIAALPDGVYEGSDLVDADGIDDEFEYEIKVKVTKVGDRIEADFSGTSEQARTSINGGVLDTVTAVGVALKYLIDPSTPFNSGIYRSIDVVLPARTICSAQPPDGAVFLYWEAAQPALLSIFRALEAAVKDNAVAGDYGSLLIHTGHGLLPNGTPWVTAAQCGGEHGAWGATKAGDADSYNSFYMVNSLDPATEAIESDCPIVVLRKEYVPDTAGAGYNRGGATVLRDSMYLTEAHHTSSPVHTKRPSGHGACGGKAGRNGATWLFPSANFDVAERRDLIPVDDPNIYRESVPVSGLIDPENNALNVDTGEYVWFGVNPIWHTKPNDVFRYMTSGGGGWGDPYSREPERVLRDVRDEYMTIAGAAREYGVIVKGDPRKDPEGLVVDEEATRERREELRRATDN